MNKFNDPIKRLAKKVARLFPGVRRYMEKYEQTSREVVSLKQTVTRLEERNNEWAAEVRALRADTGSLKIIWPVNPADIIQADWRHPKPMPSFKTHRPPFSLNWVVPPMGPVSGGHADIFRAINYLESKGHSCRVYFYDPLKSTSFEQIKHNLKQYSPLKSQLFYNADQMDTCDAIFATSWHTAYPVFNYAGSGKKFYFVQDYEPYFEPVGTYSILAENTYRFGFYGITLGHWLDKKLSRQFGMACDHIELGVDLNEYHVDNHNQRKDVLFYARPVTPRRGFELGVLALAEFHGQHPDSTIHFVGWDITPYEIPFPYINHGILSPAKLNTVYNQCAAGLVLSFTNMSLLPLEMLAAGCVPVVNDAEHTRLAGYADQLVYAPPAPRPLAGALNELVNDPNNMQRPKAAAAAAQDFQWAASFEKLEQILATQLSR